MDVGALLQAVLGGGAAAQVATVAILLSIRKENKEANRRISRLERGVWPDVFGRDTDC
ncbi:hypothetical protein [Alloalcanivorax mobilis]|uniref:hypothetical protein n=1 Tax=Alloalcanivorax mobilis TaxID=2019569 RepID=UPI0012FFD4E0|nr:hypothetical protein [Alloalcanivorax mobilis]